MPEYPVDQPLTVIASVNAGSLELAAEERTTATVDVQPYDESAASRELAAQTTVELRDGVLTVSTPKWFGQLFRLRSGGVRIRIQVPTDSGARIQVGAAQASCRGRYADLDLKAASGDVRVEHVAGAASVQTASGDIRIGQVDGGLRVSSASGDISAGHLGGSAELTLASGDLQVDELTADLSAKTASGDVRISATDRGKVRIRTASGDVSVGVRAGTGVWLDLATASGRTRNGLDLGSTPPRTDGPQLSLEVRTASGDIEVHRAG